jgi:uncharacterized protein YkwD
MIARAPPLLALALLVACGDSSTATSDNASDDAATSEANATSETATSSSASTSGETSETSADSEGADDPWSLPYCQPVADDRPVNGWPTTWGEREAAMLAAVNELRATPTTCGVHGQLPAVSPLTMNSRLRCAARNHSADMSVRGFFGHKNPDGQLPADRFTLAGYAYAITGENVAGGLTLESAAQAIAGLQASDDHCAIMMGASYTEFGAGFYEGEGDLKLYWTQTFARPAGT